MGKIHKTHFLMDKEMPWKKKNANDVIGKRIRAAMKMNDIGFAELQRKMRMSFVELKRYECGQVVPDSRTLIRLAKALDVSVEYLLRPFDVELEIKERKKKKKKEK